MSEQYDVIVIGGGAAGLSGALTLGRARRRVLVIDGGRPRNAPADGVHNYLGRENTAPGELLRIGREEVRRYGVEIIDDTVVRAYRDGAALRVEPAGGGGFTARRLLVTTGVVDELPDIPGLADGWGHWVLHCPYCHGWEVQDRPIGIIATSPMAVHAATLWPQWTGDLILFTNGQQLESAPANVKVVDGVVTKVEARGVHLEGDRFVPREAIVVQTTLAATADFLDELGLKRTPLEMQGVTVAQYIAADPTGRTDVPGVWVAGNIADPMGQVITSAAGGMKAGAALNMDLLQEP
ncbi:NAD(P)/FAD-dependent oxidoreductase [Dactylosporangium matsuzakiense]|uniref:Thioredoxin reductase n=1 Tax=Dactylosporangium matsuzakiense TaxID=53360 RepID=A0A9W6KV10_9ACTN|nr:NAD(P)/FAD-dependent oxidoreductase [Dactylosporangium matsuzakiense]UWZ41763.1 NAD(P)/FAD-dependent oxidoreductase [Dactylosporangium matsuzakiense]GLL06935.1 thioredoxin reductase [Dactylosporangium matsuzakiense]